MTRILITAAMLLGPLAFAAGPSAKDARQVLDKVQTAFNQHDGTKLADSFAPDATLIIPETGKILHGRANIANEMKQEMKQQFQGSHSTFTLDGIRPIGANAMWVDATHQLTDMRKPDGSHGPMSFHVTALLEKVKGSWQVVEARPYAFVHTAQQMGTGGSGK